MWGGFSNEIGLKFSRFTVPLLDWFDTSHESDRIPRHFRIKVKLTGCHYKTLKIKN
jgi:hypothetical protein